MAHRTEGPDYITYGTPAKRINKDSPAPGTVVNANVMNMVQEEICLAIEDAGIPVNASGAADASAGWGQLKVAIRALANKRLEELLPYLGGLGGMTAVPTTTQTVTSALQTKSPTTFLTRLTTSLGTPCVVSLEESDTNYLNQIIMVQNIAPSMPMLVAGAYIKPGGGCMYRYESSNSAGSKWVPMRPRDTDELLEGTGNLFWTNGRFDTRLAAKSTDNLTEGSTNLYYLDSRVTSRIYNDLVSDAFTQGLVTGLATTAANAAIASAFTTGTVACTIYGTTTGNPYINRTIRWTKVYPNLISVFIPSFTITTVGVESGIKIYQVSATVLPAPLNPVVNAPLKAVKVLDGSTSELSWIKTLGDYFEYTRDSGGYANAHTYTFSDTMLEFHV